jgi:glycerol-3-phosphate dehydrogenase (NAD(P)+)
VTAAATSAPTAKLAVAVLGAGSWGTALGVHLARTGHRTVLWGRNAQELSELARARRNSRYLPGVELPPSLTIEPDLGRALADVDDLLVVVPSHAFRELLVAAKPLLRPGTRVAWATKGFELQSGLLPNQVASAVLGPAVATAVLSGPTFAREVGAGLPTAMTIASRDESYALKWARSLSSTSFRAYSSTDVTGVEVGGATKNVLAIGAGCSDGLGYGANTRVALITRGLAEMMRLGVALGADKETFMGLAGLGDLVLTCTDDQSRNRRHGLALARGVSPAAAQAAIGQVVEGVLAARAVRDVARRSAVEMPITEQIYRVLYENVTPKVAVQSLMQRAVRSEQD